MQLFTTGKNHNLLAVSVFTGLLALSGNALANHHGTTTHSNANSDMRTSANVNYDKVTPANQRNASIEPTLQKKIVGPDGELLATQPGVVEVNTNNEVTTGQRAHQSATRDMNRATTESVAYGQVTPAQALDGYADNTLQRKVHGPDGELLATQPGRIEMDGVNTRNDNMSNTMSDQNGYASNQPLLKGETYGNITPADMRSQPAPITLQQRIQDKRGELVATQPGEVQIQERRKLVVQP